MNKISLYVSSIIFFSLTLFSQPYSRGNLFPTYNSNVNQVASLDVGIRNFDNYGATFAGGSVLFLNGFTFGAEYSSQLNSPKGELLFLFLRYDVSDNFTLGSFLNYNTERYGVFANHKNNVLGIDYLLSVGIDFNRGNYFFLISNPIRIDEQLFVSNELIVSEGKIQTNDNIELILVSTGLGYEFSKYIVAQANVGVNLMVGLDELNYQIVLGYRI